jgi:hypothetical protein
MIWLFSFTARRASSGISAPQDARRMRAAVPFSAKIRESFSRSSGPGWQPEVLLRMQVKPEDATWFHYFQIAERYRRAMRWSMGIRSSEGKSTTHMSFVERVHEVDRKSSFTAHPLGSAPNENKCVYHSSDRFLRLNPKTPKQNDEASRRLKVPEIRLLPNNCRKKDSNQLMDSGS